MTRDELMKAFYNRRNEIHVYLTEHAPEVFSEQRHLDKHPTTERVYWHYGYWACLTDLLNQLERMR